MEQHPLFWPHAATATYPTEWDQPGGSGIGSLATGVLPIGDISHLGVTVGAFVGGPNAIFGPRSDRGKTQPTDSGFVAGEVEIADAYADVEPGA
jgi:hypothetical protein